MLIRSKLLSTKRKTSANHGLIYTRKVICLAIFCGSGSIEPESIERRTAYLSCHHGIALHELLLLLPAQLLLLSAPAASVLGATPTAGLSVTWRVRRSRMARRPDNRLRYGLINFKIVQIL